jgi:hypothetical protein
LGLSISWDILTPQARERDHPGFRRGRPLRKKCTTCSGRDSPLADEVGYIQRRAADHDCRIVTIAQLVLFSTQTGDAWLLHLTDRLAARLAQDGDSEAVHIEETDTMFAIARKGRYRIEGPAFIYSDRDTGRTITILGYPTDKLAQMA